MYVPARMRRDRRMPLLVVHDGGDFLNHSSMGTVLDNLMHRRLMADCVVAFTHPGDRLREYAAEPAHSRFLTTELVPQRRGHVPAARRPAAGGCSSDASFGGVAALAAAVRAPGFYGGLLLESPSLRFTGGARRRTATARSSSRWSDSSTGSVPVRERVVDRIFLTYGVFEPLAEPDRAMVEVLEQMTGELRVVEALDGHNWINWRDRLLDGLGWLFPGDARLDLSLTRGSDSRPDARDFPAMKRRERWYSGRLGVDVTVARWGHFGTPVIVFPTAGGDAEEIERMWLVDSVGEYLEAGRVKLYSCDSVSGAAMLRGDGDPRYRAALLRGFLEFVRHELIPMIRMDCESPEITVITAGASIGAFNAVALLCHYPDVVTQCRRHERDVRHLAIRRRGCRRRPLLRDAVVLPPRSQRRAPRAAAARATRSSRRVRGGGRTSVSRGASRTCSGARASPTGSTRGAPSTTTTGRRGGRCCRSISTSWRDSGLARRIAVSTVPSRQGWAYTPSGGGGQALVVGLDAVSRRISSSM